jgi:hypothetical protein
MLHLQKTISFCVSVPVLSLNMYSTCDRKQVYNETILASRQ